MVFDHFRISDTDGMVLDLSDLRKLELRNENVQFFGARCDETVIATRKKPDDAVFLEKPVFQAACQADQLKQLLALHKKTPFGKDN